jgi:hypothetical protein
MAIEPGVPATVQQNYGPECPVPGYRSLDAGEITVQGTGLQPVRAEVVSLGPPESGQVAGLRQSIAILAPGSIKAGRYRVTAAGGADVGAFDSTLDIGGSIDVVAPARVLSKGEPLAVRWSGGSPDEWVTVAVTSRLGTYDKSVVMRAAGADGVVTFRPGSLAVLPSGTIELDIKVEPRTAAAVVAPGLSLGGDHTWLYVYRFAGHTLE